MAAGDSWDSWLIAGLAAHIAANTSATWRTSGAYTAGEIGIYDRAIPQTPDTILTLALYVVTAEASATADVAAGVQVRIRGTEDPRICRDLGAEVFDLLDSSGRQFWGSGAQQVSIVDVFRQSQTSLGQDGNGRWEASHNYYVSAMRPTVHRTD